MYTCPMHSEIKQQKPGRCPKCGMKLILESEMKHISHHEKVEKTTWQSYMPLIVIIAIIILTTFTLSVRDIQLELFNWKSTISYFMIGFFLTFSTFKLIDLKGFAQGYSTYDLLAKRWYGYGYVYPFIELNFGLQMIMTPENRGLLWIELVVMVFSGLGVAIKLMKHEKFQCACLGTFLKVPLTYVTLIEDFGMAILAGLLLIL